MPNDELNALVDRKRQGEEGLGVLILERIAKDVYDRPGLYGFKSEDDVGEVFERYWTRIGGLADRYEDMGCGFQAFLVSSLRYMARSIRRKNAFRYDREETINEDAKALLDPESMLCRLPLTSVRHHRASSGFPRRDDLGQSATAFRRRMLFICVKCANVIDDGEAEGLAKAIGLDEDELLQTLTRARASGFGTRQRTESRRRGRDAAWLRMGAASRRLTREVDVETRRWLTASIEKDRGLYIRAVRLIARSSPMISNKAVAELLCIPKGTVDCGVGRIMRRYKALYRDQKDV
ncbi:MAG: hypothetical protein A2Y38_20700 [Spirochaetes bacterium GWB1_59_5]|nr:MAG: hypothetical protein A2Y38_20700 [Spirochaetes bacterium GWB1_59_5]